MPSSPTRLPAWFHTKTVLNGRAAASTGAKIKYVRPKGFNLYLRKVVKAGGRTWYVSGHGTYYAAEYLLPGKAPKPKPKPKPFRIGSPVPGRRVTTPWGKRPPYRNGRPLYWTTRKRHTGDDYACPRGTKVVAVRSGTVHRRWDTVLGNVCLLFADNGKTYWYCHLSSYVGRNGRRVKAGEVIGKAGATGTGALGPHLHFEVRNGHTTSWAGRDFKPTW